MIRMTHTVDISRPISDVFGFVADQRNEAKWHTDVTEADPMGPITLGSTVTWTVKFMGENQYVSEVTQFDAPNLIQLKTIEGVSKPTLTHTFESNNGTTRYTRSVRIPAEGPFRYLGPILQATGFAHRRNARFAENLKTLLEQSTDRA